MEIELKGIEDIQEALAKASNKINNLNPLMDKIEDKIYNDN